VIEVAVGDPDVLELVAPDDLRGVEGENQQSRDQEGDDDRQHAPVGELIHASESTAETEHRVARQKI
jgi:hypothetical protein